MGFLDFLFSKPKKTAELLRENKLMLNRSIRELDRESSRLEREEQKTIADMKRLAKQGETDTVQSMALNLIRSRQYRKQFVAMRANIQTVALKVQSMKSQDIMTQVMRSVTRVVTSMNKRLNLSLFNNLVRNFERQSDIMDLKEEMADEAIDDIMNEGDEPLKKEAAIKEILDELGIQLTEKGDTLSASNQILPIKQAKQMEALTDEELRIRLEKLKQMLMKTRNVHAEITLNLAQSIYLQHGGSLSRIARLQKKVAFSFLIEQLKWDEFKIELIARNEKDLKKVVEYLSALLKAHSSSKIVEGGAKKEKPNQDFARFKELPMEIKQMIIDRVPYVKPGKNKYDGRGLLELRLVSRQFKNLADRTLMRERRCSKKRIFLAENFRSNMARLGTPPIISEIVVSIKDLDHIFGMVSLVGPKEVYVRGEFREDWSSAVMEVLLRSKNIKPLLLIVQGTVGKAELYHQYVKERPSLECLIFEKIVPSPKFFKVPFMPKFKKTFYDLGKQNNQPENIRNGYSVQYIYTRNNRAAGYGFGHDF